MARLRGRTKRGGWAARIRRAAVRLARDERGGIMDYLLVLAVLVVPLVLLFDRLLEVLADYFGMIAFYASWPFL